MAAINSNALSKFVGILEVAPQATPGVLTRVASVRGLVSNFDNTVNAVDIKADDTGTVFKGYIPEVRFEGSFLENADRDTIVLLLGGTPSDVAGVLVGGASQVLASGDWAYNGANIVDGMPWSFEYNGQQVTHEHDDCYLLPGVEATLKMTPAHMLITDESGTVYPRDLNWFQAVYEPDDV